ncbi:MAG: hypothetical protein OEV00_14625, partial [Acidobacteriota bacterium]|nr:hypothetical protein [Acidobacteriota bacterium]
MTPRSRIVRTLFALAVVLAIVATAAVWRVHRATNPPLADSSGIDFASMKIPVEEIEFRATDGVSLRGWWIPGEPGNAPLV